MASGCSPIEDYALIGDTHTTALVDRRGSIDWWCVPQIDSPACFAALLGTADHGRWLICPVGAVDRVERCYEPDTLILETTFHTAEGSVALVDFMPPEGGPAIHREVIGLEGAVRMRMELIVRFDYGSITPWVRTTGDGQELVAGGEGLRFHSSVGTRGEALTTIAEFTAEVGEREHFSLTWFAAHLPTPLPVDTSAALHLTRVWWTDWVQRCSYRGEWRDDVVRSLITLKALQYSPTGAIAAAATTSLPEQIGGVRNWDYRFSWLRDATFTLRALLLAGYDDEALEWANWLRRAVAGHPGEFQIMYGVHGERRLTEMELPWLPGYEGSTPVRIGNAATQQFQLDVFGEVMDAAFTAARAGLRRPGYSSGLILELLKHLESEWELPDDGIWEVRGPRQQFTHSKVMAWVAFDRGVRMADHGAFDDLDADEHVRRWRDMRARCHDQICDKGWNEARGAFTQAYGSDELDASLLMMAPVGFLPPEDPRIVATVDAIANELMEEGFVMRYRTETGCDGLPPGEGAFLMTTLWLADNLAMMGRRDEAVAIFDRVCAVRNDVGLLAEEYDPRARRMLGNFPQAFSHVALITTAANLSGVDARHTMLS